MAMQLIESILKEIQLIDIKFWQFLHILFTRPYKSSGFFLSLQFLKLLLMTFYTNSAHAKETNNK